MGAVILADFIGQRDVRMVNLLADFHFTLKAGQPASLSFVRRQHLQGGEPVGALVAGQIDHAHAPLADRSQDLVRS